MSHAYSSQQALATAVLKLLKPLIRVMLRNGLPFAAFAEIAKRAYVEVAAKEFGVPGKRQSNSRIAIITGLTRKEIQRLVNETGAQDDEEMINRYNRAARVVYVWCHDEKYTDDDNQSIHLPFDSEDKYQVTFSQLVKEYSGDVPPRAILDELLRVGVVRLDVQEHIELLAPAYIPTTGEAEKLLLLGRDVSGLIATMDRNIHGLGDKPHFQRKVFYDNLPNEAVEGIHMLLASDGQALLEKFDKYMSENDRDSNPTVRGEGRRAIGVGLYFFEEPVADEIAQSLPGEVSSLEQVS